MQSMPVMPRNVIIVRLIVAACLALAAPAHAGAPETMTPAALRLDHLPEPDVASAALTAASR